MTNWYKVSYEVTDFDDRNIVNHKIEFFETLIDDLHKATKAVFQNASDVRKLFKHVLKSKEIADHDKMKLLLSRAYHESLDNPWKVVFYCEEIARLSADYISSLKSDRDKFTNK